MRLLILPLCLLTCLPLFTSCQKAGDAATETGSDTVAERMAGRDVDVSQGKDGVTINAKDAQLQIARDGKALSMPADFPADVFVPSGFVVRSSMAVPRMLTVSGDVSGTVADVFGQARAAMQQQGWREKFVQQRPTMQMLSLQKDGREAVINVMERQGAVQVSYSLRMPRNSDAETAESKQ
jgi:hypothetical protein